MEKEEICPTDQLALVWHKLNCGEWDGEVLGDMPEGVDPFLVRANAAKAIEEIVRAAEIDRVYHTEVLKESTDEWFRWYTVGRFRYAVLKKEKKRRKRWIKAVIATILLAIAAHIARYLLGL